MSPFEEQVPTFGVRPTSQHSLFELQTSTLEPSHHHSSSSTDSENETEDALRALRNSIEIEFCFCGKPCKTLAEEDEARIYCSSACARKDAMSALLAGLQESENESDSDCLRTPVLQIVKETHNQSPPRISRKPVPREELKNILPTTSMERLRGTSHYRKVGALRRSNGDSMTLRNQNEEETFSTPPSRPISIEKSNFTNEDFTPQRDSRLSVSKENYRTSPSSDGQRLTALSASVDSLISPGTCSSTSMNLHRSLTSAQLLARRRVVSLPSTPSLDADEEEARQQRQRQAAIEKEIADLDSQLKERFALWDSNSETSSICFGEDLEPTDWSPRLDFEAPVGWRRRNLHSNNFLGLSLYGSPALRNDKLGFNGLDGDMQRDDMEFLADCEIEDGDDSDGLPDSPATPTAPGQLCYRSDKYDALGLPTKPAPLNLLEDNCDRLSRWSDDEDQDLTPTQHRGFAAAQEELLMKNQDSLGHSHFSPGKTLKKFASPSRRYLASLFHRRPTQSSPHGGISSADLNLTPRLSRTAPPLYATLAPAPLR